MNKLTQDQIAAAMRHYSNSAASFAVGVVVTLIAGGLLTPEQVDMLLTKFNEMADGFGKLLPLLLIAIPYLMSRKASQSASPQEQVRKVEEQVRGVVVTPVTPARVAVLKKATGVEKPIAVPTVIEGAAK